MTEINESEIQANSPFSSELEVEFTHLLTNRWTRRENRAIQDGIKLTQGVVTIAYTAEVLVPVDPHRKLTRLTIGASFVHPNDQFKKSEGRERAAENLTLEPLTLPYFGPTTHRGIQEAIITAINAQILRFPNQPYKVTEVYRRPNAHNAWNGKW